MSARSCACRAASAVPWSGRAGTLRGGAGRGGCGAGEGGAALFDGRCTGPATAGRDPPAATPAAGGRRTITVRAVTAGGGAGTTVVRTTATGAISRGAAWPTMTAALRSRGATVTAAAPTGRAWTNVSRETTVTAPGMPRFTYVTFVTLTLIVVTDTCG